MPTRLLGFLLAASTACAEVPAVNAAREWRQTHEHAIIEELTALLAIPNIATDQPNIRKNAAMIQSMIERRGLKSRLLEYPGASPVVYAELPNPDAKLTVVFYAHYDGQPLDAKEWASPPFEPVLRTGPLDKDGIKTKLPATGPVPPEWRIYARSASDDKAPIVAILTALDAMKAAGIRPTVNLKLVFEGEEEAGSTNLGKILERNKDLLKSDVWLICDGPVDQSRRRQIVFGARGVETVDLTVYGPKRELHSGHYGNWAPNPAFMLARLLASMKDDDGRVLIEGYYDGMLPLSELDQKALKELPDNDAALKQELWLGRTEGGGKTLSELLTLPSLNVRGMAAARVAGGASNVIPASATATIDMRLVQGVTKRACCRSAEAAHREARLLRYRRRAEWRDSNGASEGGMRASGIWGLRRGPHSARSSGGAESGAGSRGRIRARDQAAEYGRERTALHDHWNHGCADDPDANR
jgi:acetylornithine deacetylase/succinyl-diaminopimelate desuccinylase-like protein